MHSARCPLFFAMSTLYTHPNSNARLLEYDMTRYEEIIEAAVKSVEGALEEHPALPSMYGREARMNRNVGFFGDKDATHGYFFSGQLMRTKPLTEPLAKLLGIVNTSFGGSYNGILVNEYNDGNDYISDHRDDETGLDPQYVLAISWGDVRTLRIKVWDAANNRPLAKKAGGWVCDAVTKSCYALCMQGSDFQKLLSHGIPSEKSCSGRRVSLTFRMHNKTKEEPLYNRWVRKQKKRTHNEIE